MKEYKGLSESEVIESREKFGSNEITPPTPTPWWKLYLEKFKDPIIKILLFAAVASLIVGIIENSFVESIGIIVAILLATGVGFYMEFSSQQKFESLKSLSNSELVKVIRDGVVTEIPKDKLVVNDIVIISAGDEVPADIELLESIDIKVDESTMTGESIPVSKCEKMESKIWDGSGFPYYTLLRSTNITEGNGVGKVVKVGDETEIGKISRSLID